MDPRLILPRGEPIGPYSHSKLSTFENCPRHFEYRYIQKIRRDTESIEGFLGKRVHGILERLYHHLSRHGRPPSLRQVLDRFHKDWSLHWHDQVEIIRTERSIKEYVEQGDRCLGNYYRGHYPFDRGETVAVEEKITIDLDGRGTYRARGVVDRIAREAPGRYEIHDYKTGAYLPPQRRLDKDRQLALYQIGLEQKHTDVESVSLVWHYLLFNKTLRSQRTPEALDKLKADSIVLIDRIEATTEYAPKPGPLCRWCEYRDICPDALLPSEEPEPPFPPGDVLAPAPAAPASQGAHEIASGGNPDPPDPHAVARPPGGGALPRDNPERPPPGRQLELL